MYCIVQYTNLLNEMYYTLHPFYISYTNYFYLLELILN